MNWCVVVESNLSGQYAIRTHVLEFCRSLSQSAPVTLLSQTSRAELKEEITFNNLAIPARRFKPVNLSEILNTFRAYKSLSSLHKTSPIDVLYIRATAYGLGPLVFARLRRIQHFLEINGAWDAESKLSRQGLPQTKRMWVAMLQQLRWLSLDLACQLADNIIVVTPQLGEYLKSKGIKSEKIYVVSNGVNPVHFSPKPKETVRRYLGLSSDEQVIGFVGSLAAWQGLDILIDAFASITRCSYRTRRLIIVGDGAEHGRLEELVISRQCESSVVFAGAKSYDEIPNIIAACDVLIAPKRPLVSGYSTLKVYEYLACARPVIAARLPGLELIEEARAGILFTPGDPVDLATALSAMLELPDSEREAMGNRGRNFVIEHYTWDKTVQSILSLVKR